MDKKEMIKKLKEINEKMLEIKKELSEIALPLIICEESTVMGMAWSCWESMFQEIQYQINQQIKEKPHPSLEECGFDKEKHSRGFII